MAQLPVYLCRLTVRRGRLHSVVIEIVRALPSLHAFALDDEAFHGRCMGFGNLTSFNKRLRSRSQRVHIFVRLEALRVDTQANPNCVVTVLM